MIWTVWHLWLSGAQFTFNSYFHHTQLNVWAPGGMDETVYNQDGVTHGDIFVTEVCGLEGVLLIHNTKK